LARVVEAERKAKEEQELEQLKEHVARLEAMAAGITNVRDRRR